MSMTREETIHALKEIKDYIENDDASLDCRKAVAGLDFAVSALRPVSLEEVGKVWRGEWVPYLDGEHIMPERYYRCSKCGDRGYMRKRNFCPCCGAPMMDEAVEMVVERINKMEGMKK